MKRSIILSTESKEEHIKFDCAPKTMSNSGVGCVLDRFPSVSPNGAFLSFASRKMMPSSQDVVAGRMTDVGHLSQSVSSSTASLISSSSCHVCRVCSKTFRASSLLDIHMRVHVGAKPFVCPDCGHRATQKGNLKLHMKKHHGADLPPHIDLVPDSGIWGHPEENISFSQQVLEGIYGNGDASGKRKQVAQAVSSLLNEEVVELIKKYQNEAGQATAGTITESLEDFIRIAKSKETGRAKLTEVSETHDAEYEKCDQRKKKRLAVSLRFQPYSHANGGFSTAQTFHTSTLGYLRQLPSHSLTQELEILQRSTQTSPAAVDNKVFKEVMGARTRSADPEECEFCCTTFETPTFLKNHKKHCRVEKRKISTKSVNEKVLPCVDLIAGSSAPNRYSDSSINHSAGLDAVVNHMMQCANLPRSKSCPDLTQKSCSQLKFAMREVKTMKRPRSSDPALLSQEKRKKASSDVLTMLRQILLNGSSNTMTSSHDRFPQPKEFIEDKKDREFSHYRNPAMQSLTLIGNGMPVHQKAPVRPKTPEYCDPSMTDIGGLPEQGDTGYKCQYCPKWFRYKSVLEIHLRSHTGERPYKCPHCEYAGTQHNCLKLHIQRHHLTKPTESEILPQNRQVPSSTMGRVTSKAPRHPAVNCPVCGRASPSPGYLKIHMRSHKRSLDHVCHICGRGFKEYWYLSTHLKTHGRVLNSLKLHMERCKVYSASSKPQKSVFAAGYSGEKIFLNKFTDTRTSFPRYFISNSLGNLDQTDRFQSQNCKPCDNMSMSEKPGIICKKLQPQLNLAKGIVKIDPDVQAFDSSFMKSTTARSRRRKPICPSRVVSTPLSTAKLSVSYLTSVTEDISVQESLKENEIMPGKPTEIIGDDLPLDLRCDAKKMSDLKS